jgi:hypothetical protein
VDEVALQLASSSVYLDATLRQEKSFSCSENAKYAAYASNLFDCHLQRLRLPAVFAVVTIGAAQL